MLRVLLLVFVFVLLYSVIYAGVTGWGAAEATGGFVINTCVL